MSIRSRLEDATALWTAGRKEGAFVQILIAVAATSRKRYSRDEWDDSESFRNYVYDEMGVITGGPKYDVALPFRGRTVPLEDILYAHFRCQLLHEADLPEDINLIEPVVEHGQPKTVLQLGTPLGFPVDWIQRLATAVWLALENDSLWPDESDKRKAAREQLGTLVHDSAFCRRPGLQTKQMKNRNERMSWTEDGISFAVSYSPSVSRDRLATYLTSKGKELAEDTNISAK